MEGEAEAGVLKAISSFQRKLKDALFGMAEPEELSVVRRGVGVPTRRPDEQRGYRLTLSQG